MNRLFVALLMAGACSSLTKDEPRRITGRTPDWVTLPAASAADSVQYFNREFYYMGRERYRFWIHRAAGANPYRLTSYFVEVDCAQRFYREGAQYEIPVGDKWYAAEPFSAEDVTIMNLCEAARRSG